jgi:hypothetical protein
MPKAAKKVQQKSGQGPANANGQESVGGYFRKLFRESPKLLKARSNDEVLQRWLADHPGQTEVPERIKNNLANVKSLLRKKSQAKPAPAAGAPAEQPQAPPAGGSLEALEGRIHECLTLAKGIDSEGLAEVVRSLRRTRIELIGRLVD